MFKTVTDIREYMTSMEVSSSDCIKKIEMFGQDYYVGESSEFWHLHLKVNNNCNAKCIFCIEKDIKGKTNEYYTDYLTKVVSEMGKQKIFNSVSITGGEPLLYKNINDVINIVKSCNFLTINTNGTMLYKNIDKLFNFDCVNVSRHFISQDKNNNVFMTKTHTISELEHISKMGIPIRIQSVVTEHINIDEYVDKFHFVKDLSFRKLMTTSNIHNVSYKQNNFYNMLLNDVRLKAKFISQTVQDYYMYETWDYNGIMLNFSFSDMKSLYDLERKEDDNIIREFILHPSGVFSGSWSSNKKIINYEQIRI